MQTDDQSTPAEQRDADVERMTIGAPDLLNSQI